MKEMLIKEWFFNKQEDIARTYNCFIDKKDDTDGYVKVLVEEQIKESEKAVQVKLATGSIVGSYKGWTCWIPKSVIA